jgi:Mg-chelatase subunit ChlD
MPTTSSGASDRTPIGDALNGMAAPPLVRDKGTTVQIRLTDGILTVRVPKAPQAQARQIEIKS